MAIKVLEKYFDMSLPKHYERYSGDSIYRMNNSECDKSDHQTESKPAGSVGSTNKAESYVGARFLHL